MAFPIDSPLSKKMSALEEERDRLQASLDQSRNNPSSLQTKEHSSMERSLPQEVEDQTPHPPTPPASHSPPVSHSPPANFAESQHITFSNDSSKIATPFKQKPRRRNAKAYAGVRKRQPKKKEVHFKDPLAEIRLIDSQAAPNDQTASTPAFTDTMKKRSTRISAESRNDSAAAQIQFQPGVGIRWIGFGTNHLPRHYRAIPGREAAEQAKEEAASRELDKAQVLLFTHMVSATSNVPQLDTIRRRTLNTLSTSATNLLALNSPSHVTCSAHLSTLSLYRMSLIDRAKNYNSHLTQVHLLVWLCTSMCF